MSAFRFEALTTAGKKKTGVIEADSARSARSQLRERGLTPLHVQMAHEKPGRERKKQGGRQRLSPKDRVLFTRQLATLLSAGLPVLEAIQASAEQCEKPETRALIFAIRSRIQEGHSLAAALKEFPSAFSELYCATVAAGEKTGHLDAVLERLADYTEKQYAMRQKMLHALIYPAAMLLVATGITAFLLEFVVPRMISVYGDTGQTLPFLTQCLIAFSEGLGHWGLAVFVLLLTAGFAFRWQMKRSPHFRMSVHRLLLRLPLAGWGIRTANTARFSRTFAILSTAGVPVLDAMRIAGSLVTSLPIRATLDTAVARVREGASIHLALKQTHYFSPMTLHMVASGEASGQLENMLERAAANEENDITQVINTCLALSEPAIIILMGSIVLFIVLAVLLPIFQLDQLNL